MSAPCEAGTLLSGNAPPCPAEPYANEEEIVGERKGSSLITGILSGLASITWVVAKGPGAARLLDPPVGLIPVECEELLAPPLGWAPQGIMTDMTDAPHANPVQDGQRIPPKRKRGKRASHKARRTRGGGAPTEIPKGDKGQQKGQEERGGGEGPHGGTGCEIAGEDPDWTDEPQ